MPAMDSVLTLRCPDCHSTLRVDRATGAVLSHQPAVSRKPGSLEEAARESAKRRTEAEDLFAASFEREQKKSEILEKTFQEALERAKKDPSKPRGIFDDD